ncbi:unnamed protein product [Penicillium nalgiovense]|uniref:Uncharacterized protein n=1 Tax=Penicillium nalgiovense TaxID=60175 RepID=A0A9W4IQZ8_PENNA|nr:unnamed protein product [Penicillium nalgiovense]CAG7979925.1 unnamed protein product [Penicillium nalgiovense]CAG7986279.1 unnamed protein product [Penicillium nalgiovense]CAG7990972.1 unnamed protein product [Penicillium nalgiovense]CAG7991630.1 unnamed protein product [Penicillium nalgiovense]
MHRLRDSLLSPSPKGFPDIGELDSISQSRQDTRQSLSRGEFKDVREAAFFNRTWVTDRYCNVGDGVDSLDRYLRDIWYMYYQLSLYTSHETPDHDRLVFDILRIQGSGPLTRPVKGKYGVEIARMAEGTLWNDLPFLVTDMTDFWINNCGPMSGTQRLNFASFLAKLASTRVCKDRMCQVVLIIFPCTFEERQEARTTDYQDNEDPNRGAHSLEIMHLLPAACVWLDEAGSNLLRLSEVSWNDCPSTIGQGGPCFIESEFGSRSPTGFTPWRWMFWLKQLHEIRESAKETNENRLEEYAANAICAMVREAEERNSDILRVYQTAGYQIYQDKHLVCLKHLVEGEKPEQSDLQESEYGMESEET